MKQATVTLKKMALDTSVTITLTVAKSLKPKIQSELMERPPGVRCSNGTYLTSIGAEALAFSGVGSAFLSAHDRDYDVNVKSVSGEILDIADRTVCARVAFVGAAYATGHKEIVTDDWLDGWTLISADVTEVTH